MPVAGIENPPNTSNKVKASNTVNTINTVNAVNMKKSPITDKFLENERAACATLETRLRNLAEKAALKNSFSNPTLNSLNPLNSNNDVSTSTNKEESSRIPSSNKKKSFSLVENNENSYGNKEHTSTGKHLPGGLVGGVTGGKFRNVVFSDVCLGGLGGSDLDDISSVGDFMRRSPIRRRKHTEDDEENNENEGGNGFERNGGKQGKDGKDDIPYGLRTPDTKGKKEFRPKSPFSLEEEDIERVLGLIESLEARNVFLSDNLSYRDAECKQTRTRLEELEDVLTVRTTARTHEVDNERTHSNETGKTGERDKKDGKNDGKNDKSGNERDGKDISDERSTESNSADSLNYKALNEQLRSAQVELSRSHNVLLEMKEHSDETEKKNMEYHAFNKALSEEITHKNNELKEIQNKLESVEISRKDLRTTISELEQWGRGQIEEEKAANTEKNEEINLKIMEINEKIKENKYLEQRNVLLYEQLEEQEIKYQKILENEAQTENDKNRDFENEVEKFRNRVIEKESEMKIMSNENEMKVIEIQSLKQRNAVLFEQIEAHKMENLKNIEESEVEKKEMEKEIEERVSNNAEKNELRQKEEFEKQKNEAIREALDGKIKEIVALRMHNSELEDNVVTLKKVFELTVTEGKQDIERKNKEIEQKTIDIQLKTQELIKLEKYNTEKTIEINGKVLLLESKALEIERGKSDIIALEQLKNTEVAEKMNELERRNNEIEQLEQRNILLYGQLESRDNEFQNTLKSLEEMRFALSGVNNESMRATTELEERYTLLCDTLQLKNEELSSLQQLIQSKEKEDIKNKENKEKEEKEEAKKQEIKIFEPEGRTKNLTVRTEIIGEVIEEAPNSSSNTTQNSPNTPNTDLITDLNSPNLTSNSSNSLPHSPKAPLNPFAEETIRKLKETIALKDLKIEEVNRKVMILEVKHRNEEEAHGDSHDDFEMRLAILCDQLEDTRRQLEVSKSMLEDRRGAQSEGSDIDNGYTQSKFNNHNNSSNAHNNNSNKSDNKINSNNSNDNKKDGNTSELEEITREKEEMAHTIADIRSSNSALMRIGIDLNKKINSLMTPEKEGKEKDVGGGGGGEKEGGGGGGDVYKEEIIVLKQAGKEMEVRISTLLANESAHNTEIIKLNRRISDLSDELTAMTSLNNRNSERNNETRNHSFPFNLEVVGMNKNDSTNLSNSGGNSNNGVGSTHEGMNGLRNNGVSDSRYSVQSVEVFAPNSDYFASKMSRDTDFLLIPFDRVNEMTPEEVLKLLISYKLEHANIAHELDDAKNELNRIKRINIMNAVSAPMPAMTVRKAAHSSHPHPHNPHSHSKSSRHNSDKYTEKDGNDEKLSKSSISANASRFSSDVFKSTANLLRIKRGVKGSGSVVGSVAESFTTSFWGGSVKGGEGDEWEGSDGSSMHGSSAHGSVVDSHKKYVDNM